MQKQKEDNKSLVIGIISCKAGVGKSFISQNLAKQIALNSSSRPLLVDLSEPFGGSSAFIEADNESWNTIKPLLTQEIASKKLATVIKKTQEGFDYLGAPQEFEKNESLNLSQLKSLVNSSRSYSPITIFDFPSIKNKEDLEKIKLMDKILCIITPEPEVLSSSSKIYQYWTNEKVGQSWTFILNRWDRKKLPKLSEQIEKKMRIEIAGSIEEDSDALWQHYFSGKLLEHKDLVLTQDFKNLAQGII
jgi:Flp pilus assembly CpaE family ATPase